MRHVVLGFALTCSAALAPLVLGQEPPTGFVSKLGVDVDVRSGSRIFADDLNATGPLILPDATTPVPGGSSVPQIQLRGGNVQVNDPTQDYIQIFPLFRPFVHATQSETSMAAFGRNIVVTYNNSAGIHLSLFHGGPGLIVDSVQLSGFSVSNDGGQTWKSGYIPNSVGGPARRLLLCQPRRRCHPQHHPGKQIHGRRKHLEPWGCRAGGQRQ